MRLNLFKYLALALLLVACGKPETSGKSVYAYTGNGSEWDSEAVPGSPQQTRPIYSSQPRPALEQASSLSPSIYYTPKIQADGARASGCKLSQAGDWQLCEADFRNCLMQGSCFVAMGEAWRYFMKAGRADELRPRSQGRCRFGVGFGACLIPNVSVAADLSVHKIGDVLYVPALDGVNMPYIGRHDGFVIVHDKGGAIKGPHRFDFFTGHISLREQRNMLMQLGFGAKSRSFSYVKLGEREAAAVRREKGL